MSRSTYNVRLPLFFISVVLFSGCGDTVPVRAGALSEQAVAPRLSRAPVQTTSAPAPLPPPQRPVLAAAAPAAGDPEQGEEGIVRSVGSAGPLGALENTVALKHFYEALAELDAGQSHDDVTVLHFGDSHTAADFETGPLRRALQGRFGDGGRGFVAIGEPWKHYVQEGLRNGCTHDWTAERSHPTKASKGRLVGDGMYGLCGVALHTDRAGARAWGEYTAKSSRIDIAYLAQPHGGSFDVYVDGARAGHVSTSASAPASAWHPLATSDGPHRVEIVASGDGDVRLFGAELDRDQVGVTYDALGINGARITNVLAWDEQHMAEQIRHRDPDLVVLAYGTNESGDTDVPIDVYERQLVDLLGRVARAAPSASCMLLGPPDRAVHTREGWGTLPRLLDIIAAQRRVARAAGCAFFDQLEAMGGPGTIAQWAEEPQPRAARDRVHLSREGYSQLGNAVAGELIQGYAQWRAESGLGPVESGTSEPLARAR
ncbi:MAG: GDSL-type esterase/lipase family protein [Polyangiaceae bacterium]